MNSLYADFFTAFNVDKEVIHKDGFLRIHPTLIQGNLEDLRVGLHRAHLRRDDQPVEGVIKFFPDYKIAQVTPGVRDESGFIFAAQRADVLDQRTVDNIACKEFIADEGKLRGWSLQSLDNGRPMFLGRDFADRGATT